MKASSLRRERAFRGITGSQVARRMGWGNQSMVSKLERGALKVITRARVAAYARATGISTTKVARHLREMGVEIVDSPASRAA